MCNEVIEMSKLKKGMTVVDATLGGGGYTLEIYKRIMPGGTLIAIDADITAIKQFEKDYSEIAKNIQIVHSNYSHIRKILKDLNIERVNAIVADLGLSSDQIYKTDRGFSFMNEDRLDMRMNQFNKLTANFVVNDYSQEELTRIIKEFGDEKFATVIAKNIYKHRPVQNTKFLASIIVDSIPDRVKRKQKIHPATKTFQAIRMEVNKELDHLKIFLTEGINVLQKSGHFSVVSFHSGEDRVVKNIFRANARGCICDVDMPICVCNNRPKVRIVTKKPIKPKEKEIRNNSCSRSARLRVVEKL